MLRNPRVEQNTYSQRQYIEIFLEDFFLVLRAIGPDNLTHAPESQISGVAGSFHPAINDCLLPLFPLPITLFPVYFCIRTLELGAPYVLKSVVESMSFLCLPIFIESCDPGLDLSSPTQDCDITY